ncbi:MAG TPA: AraC family transcriptional regulator [Cyclobacteriaceae bacterium]|nr:AraC family transcriptional regulator [Cyclobacteriaceae bacterium]
MVNFYDYVTQGNLFKKFEVDELLFVEYKCLIPDSRVGFWTPNNYFEFVLGGRKKWLAGDREFAAEAGEARFVKHGAYIAERYHDHDYCALLIFVPDHFIKTVLNKYPGGVPQTPKAPFCGDPIVTVHVDDSLSAYFHSVLTYFKKAGTPSRELLTVKFEELILNILSSSQNEQLADHFAAIYSCGKVPLPAIMEQFFMSNMSLAEYARLCARSLSAFKAEFQEVYGMSPGKWLISKRLEFARHLLETTEESISDITLRSGFKNTSHFVRLFKETYGKPPLQYRQQKMLTVG